MSSTVLKMQPARSAPSGPDDDSASQVSRVRDALAYTHQRIEARWPNVLDVHARVLVARGAELRGVAGALRGTHEEGHWRSSLRGERSLPDVDLTRLTISARPEALRAVQAGDRARYAAAGLAVAWAPLVAPLESVGEAAAGIVESASRLSAAILRDQSDGRIDSPGAHLDAIAVVERELAEAKAVLLDLVAARARATTGGRRTSGGDDER